MFFKRNKENIENIKKYIHKIDPNINIYQGSTFH